MDSAEFGEWSAFYAIEPWGGRIDDLRMGTIAALTANVHRGIGVKAFKPDDFVSWTYSPPAPTYVKPPEVVAMDAFGIDLAAAKKSGTKTIIIKRPTRG
jgi:hypothetical protein